MLDLNSRLTPVVASYAFINFHLSFIVYQDKYGVMYGPKEKIIGKLLIAHEVCHHIIERFISRWQKK